jgi:leucyl-tRNA---protein transferase
LKSHALESKVATLEITVLDSPHPCSYLPGRTARLPYRHPVKRLSPEEFDQRLAEGDRRTGVFLYRPQCPHCRACEPIRLDVHRFRPNATQRRELRRGDAILELKLSDPIIDQRRIDLFNLHRDTRGLGHHGDSIDRESYAEFLATSCCETWELSYWHGPRLVAVAITDFGRTSLSAVYCYFNPTFGDVSLGTYSVLKQGELCRNTDRRYLYLGFFIADASHMSYKARFHPNERRIDGTWREFP